MAYFLFILLNATLFIRPSELIPDLATWRIYLTLILACAACSLPQIANTLTKKSLSVQPITVCVLGVLVAVVMSHLSHLFIWGARMDGFEFSKVVLYYLLLVSLVDTERKLKNFLLMLAGFILIEASLALLQEYGAIHIVGMESLTRREGVDAFTGEAITFQQLRGTGIFNDPNDLAMILVAGIVLCLFFFTDKAWGLLRFGWMLPLGVMVYAFALTKSRGGFLALLGALGALSYYHFGWKKTLALGIVGIPLMFVAFAGRMTDIGAATDSGTGQSRIQIWSESFGLMKQAPLFGIGKGMLGEEIGHVAHNSFVQAYAELGVFGGTFFFGCFFSALAVYYKLRKHPEINRYPQLHRMVPYLAALTVGFSVSMLTLSRGYIVPTYMMLGLSAIVGNIANVRLRMPILRFNKQFATRLAPLSVCFLISIYLFMRVTVRWG